MENIRTTLQYSKINKLRETIDKLNRLKLIIDGNENNSINKFIILLNAVYERQFDNIENIDEIDRKINSLDIGPAHLKSTTDNALPDFIQLIELIIYVINNLYDNLITYEDKIKTIFEYNNANCINGLINEISNKAITLETSLNTKDDFIINVDKISNNISLNYDYYLYELCNISKSSVNKLSFNLIKNDYDFNKNLRDLIKKNLEHDPTFLMKAINIAKEIFTKTAQFTDCNYELEEQSKTGTIYKYKNT